MESRVDPATVDMTVTGREPSITGLMVSRPSVAIGSCSAETGSGAAVAPLVRVLLGVGDCRGSHRADDCPSLVV